MEHHKLVSWQPDQFFSRRKCLCCEKVESRQNPHPRPIPLQFHYHDQQLNRSHTHQIGWFNLSCRGLRSGTSCLFVHLYAQTLFAEIGQWFPYVLFSFHATSDHGSNWPKPFLQTLRRFTSDCLTKRVRKIIYMSRWGKQWFFNFFTYFTPFYQTRLPSLPQIHLILLIS